MELTCEYMDESIGGTLSVKPALFRSLLFLKPSVPTSAYLPDTLQDCIKFSWCICMYNRVNYIGPSPAIDPTWMVCTGTAMSICNVRSIIIVGLQHCTK